MFNFKQSSDVKSDLDTSDVNTECTCLEKENPQIKDMCTLVKELLGILESRDGEVTEEEEDMSCGHDEETMSWKDFLELTKTWIKQDVYDKNTSLNEILGRFQLA